MVLFKQHRKSLEILLIQRQKPPYQGSWALPGGKLDTGETVEQAAARELQEETGVTDVALHPFHVFSEPQRDPRGHSISVAFYGKVSATTEARAGDDASAAIWYSIDQLPPLAFDHREIIHEALRAAFPGTTLMSKLKSGLTTARVINAAIKENEQGSGKAVYAVKNGAKIRITKARTFFGSRKRQLPGELYVRSLADGHWFAPDSIIQE
jgi:8-oxo-dGTP diphosphatase